MARFDVRRMRGPKTRASLVVEMQSDYMRGIPTVLVAPLVSVKQLAPYNVINPIVEIGGEVKARAWLTENVPPGLVWMSFHFPDSPTNDITNDAGDQVTRTYEYKVCAVKVQRAETNP